MSVVLITATKDFIVFMSDGRVQGEIGGIKNILREDYKKISRLNEKICIGYTGSRELCEKSLKAIYNPYNPNAFNPLGNLDIGSISNTLCAEAKHIFSESNYPNKKITFVVGGVMADKNIGFYTFGSEYNFQVEKYIPINGDIKYASLHSDNAKGNELEHHLLANTPLNEDKIKKAMSDCIDEIADLDSSVNKIKFTEVIYCDNNWKYSIYK